MAGPTNKTFIEGQIITQHNVDLQNKDQRAQYAFVMLNQYDWQGTGPMPTVVWTAPTGFNFDFNPSNGELVYNSTAYSSLAPDKKREFFQYLPKFIVQCMKAYDDTYSL
jgi:hypothetical protein